MAELKYVDWDGLVYYDGKIKQYIQDRDENYVKMGGIVSFNELPDPTYYNLHYIYKITDDFTSNSRFDEAGLVYKAGTWVQCVDLHEDASRYRYIIFNEKTIGGTADIDLSDYYTKREVDEKIEKAIASIETPEVDLNNYYTKEEVNTLIPDISGLVTKEELEAVQNVAGSNSVKLFAIESDLVDISQQLENIPTTYATKEEIATVEAKIDAIVIPEVPTKVSELENDVEYITAKDIPQPELFVVDYNAPDFGAALEAYNNGKLLLLTNAAPDANGYAVMNYVREDLITFTKFLMSRSETYGSFNTYYLHNDNTWELAKEVKLNKVDAIVDSNNDITGLTIGKNTYEFDNFATTEAVNQINENIQNIESTYVTAEKVTEVVETQIDEVVTKEIETRVETVIQEKVDAGEIEVNADAINYDTWD